MVVGELSVGSWAVAPCSASVACGPTGGNQRAPRGGKSSDGCCPFLPQLRGLSVRVFSSDVKVLECCGVVTLVVSLWCVHSCEWLEREVQG
jgi:hypothetical protein